MAYAQISLNKMFFAVKTTALLLSLVGLSTQFAVSTSVPATAEVSVARYISAAGDRTVRFLHGIAEVDDVFPTFFLFFACAVTAADSVEVDTVFAAVGSLTL